MIKGIIGLSIGVIVFANVLMPTIKGVNTTDWSTSEVALYAVAGLGGVIGIVYGILNVFGVL